MELSLSAFGTIIFAIESSPRHRHDCGWTFTPRLLKKMGTSQLILVEMASNESPSCHWDRRRGTSDHHHRRSEAASWHDYRWARLLVFLDWFLWKRNNFWPVTSKAISSNRWRFSVLPTMVVGLLLLVVACSCHHFFDAGATSLLTGPLLVQVHLTDQKSTAWIIHRHGAPLSSLTVVVQ